MRLVFLDFEASGLGATSWPIEIGVAWISESKIYSRSSLIRPQPDWPEDAWSTESAEVHGIPRDALDAAPRAEVVAADFLPLLRSGMLVSDAPEFEERWLTRLIAALPHAPRLRVMDFDTLAHRVFAPHPLDWVYETLNRTSPPHRAEADARRLAKAWAAGGSGR